MLHGRAICTYTYWIQVSIRRSPLSTGGAPLEDREFPEQAFRSALPGVAGYCAWPLRNKYFCTPSITTSSRWLRTRLCMTSTPVVRPGSSSATVSDE